MKISFSIPIASKAEVVFSWLSSPERAKIWMESVTATEIISKTGNMIGTTFRETVEENGNKLEMEGMITQYVENKAIAFHIESKIHELEVEYLIEEASNGVRLRAETNINWKYPMNFISLFMGSRIKKNIVEQSEKEFAKLKKLCEAGK